MTHWYTLNLGDALLADQAITSTEQAVLKAYLKAGKPNNMASFIRHESEGKLHCDVMIYFSPAAAEVAQWLGAAPCSQPAPEGLGLLAGDKDCYSHYFSDEH